MTSQCVNFDFGQNWDKVVPYLQTPMMQQLLQIAHFEIAQNSIAPQNWKFDPQAAPAANLVSHDGHVTMIDTMTDKLIKQKDKRIPRKLLRDYKSAKIALSSSSKEDECEKFYNYMETREEIGKYIGCDYATSPTNMVHWLIFGSCHFTNRWIGMYLAQQICPEIHWKLLAEDEHTTVISSDGTKMFDLLAWGWNHNRHLSFCCNQPFIETDSSLGANAAIESIMQSNHVRFSTVLKRAIDFNPLHLVHSYSFV